jgi:hypothetical protein
MASEQDEMAALDRILTRLALAEDEKLGQVRLPELTRH